MVMKEESKISQIPEQKIYYLMVSFHIYDNRWVASYPSSVMLSTYSTDPDDWAKISDIHMVDKAFIHCQIN